MDDLIAFVTARLDEDEATAREAVGLTECWIAEEPAIGVVLVDGEPLIEGHITGLTAHIARHDPARVLREVAAKRGILAEHQHEKVEYPAGGHPFGCGLCEYDREYGMNGDGWCKTVRLVAAAWSDHPDYRQEWADMTA